MGVKANWVFLVLSLILAFLIWVLTNLSKDYSGVVSVPVVAQSNIEGHAMESSNTVLVSARVRTDGFRLVREGSRRQKAAALRKWERSGQAGAVSACRSGKGIGNHYS